MSYNAGQGKGDLAARMRAELARLRKANPFEVLKVPLSASGDAVRHAFLESTKIHHPNRYARENVEVRELATELFLVIRAAYEQLGDETKRKSWRERVAPASPISISPAATQGAQKPGTDPPRGAPQKPGTDPPRNTTQPYAAQKPGTDPPRSTPPAPQKPGTYPPKGPTPRSATTPGTPTPPLPAPPNSAAGTEPPRPNQVTVGGKPAAKPTAAGSQPPAAPRRATRPNPPPGTPAYGSPVLGTRPPAQPIS